MPRPLSRPLVRPLVRPAQRGGHHLPADLAPTVPFTMPHAGDFVDDFSMYADLAAYAAAYDASDPGDWWYHSGIAVTIGPALAMRLVAPVDGDGAVQYVPDYPAVVPTRGWVRARAHLSAPPSDAVGSDYTAALTLGWSNIANALAPEVTASLHPGHLTVSAQHTSTAVSGPDVPWTYTDALEMLAFFEESAAGSRVTCWLGVVGGARPLVLDSLVADAVAATMEVFYCAVARGYARGTEYGVDDAPRFEVRPGLSLADGCAAFGLTLPA